MTPRLRVVDADPPSDDGLIEDADELATLVRTEPRALEVARRALALEERHLGTEHDDTRDCACRTCWGGFEAGEVREEGSRVHRLYVRGLLVRSYMSSRVRRYRLVEPAWPRLRMTARLLAVQGALVAAAEPEEGRAARELDDSPLELPDDLFDLVVGLPEVKDALQSLLSATTPDGEHAAPAHGLMIGSPASGKSVCLEEVMRISGSVLMTGGNFTRAGLYERLLGATPPRVLVVDEIEKAAFTESGKAALHALLPVMDGHVELMQAGRHHARRCSVFVIAAGNSSKGLSEALLSRFWPIPMADYSPQQRYRVIGGFLSMREGLGIAHARAIAALCAPLTADVRQARTIARMYGGDLRRAGQLVDDLERFLGEQQGRRGPFA